MAGGIPKVSTAIRPNSAARDASMRSIRSVVEGVGSSARSCHSFTQRRLGAYPRVESQPSTSGVRSAGGRWNRDWVRPWSTKNCDAASMWSSVIGRSPPMPTARLKKPMSNAVIATATPSPMRATCAPTGSAGRAAVAA